MKDNRKYPRWAKPPAYLSRDLERSRLFDLLRAGALSKPGLEVTPAYFKALRDRAHHAVKQS